MSLPAVRRRTQTPENPAERDCLDHTSTPGLRLPPLLHDPLDLRIQSERFAGGERIHDTSDRLDISSTSEATDRRASAGAKRSRSDSGGSGGGAALDTLANNFSRNTPKSGSETRSDNRKRRFLAVAHLWSHSQLPRVAACGRFPVSALSGTGVRFRDGVAGYSGLQRCGSVWSCPRCNAQIMQRRAMEIGAAVQNWLREDPSHSIVFLTHTLAHGRADAGDMLWNALAGCWNAVTAGNGWKLDRRNFSIEGFLRTTEVTFSTRNGWHPHIHALLFLREPANQRELKRRLFARWKLKAIKQGLKAPRIVAQDVKRVTLENSAQLLGDYLTKAQLATKVGHELVSSQGKRARAELGTMTPWAILEAARDGEAWAVDAWAEWELMSKGRRQMNWSKGLRERLGVNRDMTDEEIAMEELGCEDDTVAIITPAGWRKLTARLLMAEALDACERGELAEFLEDNGIEFEWVGHA